MEENHTYNLEERQEIIDVHPLHPIMDVASLIGNFQCLDFSLYIII